MPDFDMPPARAGYPARGRWLIDRLRGEFALTEYQAAGFVGNPGYESAGFMKLREVGQPEGQGGYGWAQWTGDRRRKFLAWCVNVGLSWQSDEANVGFILLELHGDYRHTIDALRETDSLSAAVWSVGQTYERPGGTTNEHLPGFNDRLTYAMRALAGLPTVGAVDPPHEDAPTIPSEVIAAALAVSRLDKPERKLVQMGLKVAGLYTGRIDAIIGPLSRAALAAWRARG